MRVSRGQLPSKPTPCRKPCVYSEGGICSEPQINKGNGDAYCHRISNKHVLAWLRPEGKEASREG